MLEIRLCVLVASMIAIACTSSAPRGSEVPLDPSGCFRAGPDGRIHPVLQKAVNPEYPVHAHAEGIEGDVILEGSIGPDGRVVDAVVLQSQPPGVFDASALDAFRHYEYCPPRPDHPYPDRIKVRLLFDLER